MRVTLDRGEILAALALCRGVAPGGTIPILQHAHLAAAQGKLAVTVTDLDRQIEASAVGRVEANGAITAPVGKLHDLVKAFPTGGEVLLDDAEAHGFLVVRCGRSSYKLPTLPASDFPRLKRDEAGAGGDLDAGELKRMLSFAAPSASTESVRFMLTGVNLRRSDAGGLRVEATDGKGAARIEAATLAQGFTPPDAAGATIPGPAVDTALQLLGASKGLCEIRISKSAVAIEASAGSFVGKLLDSSFPDLNRVWPKPDLTLSADLELFGAAVRRAGLMAEGKETGIKLAVAEGEAVISVRGADMLGQGQEVVDVEHAGAPFEITISAKRFAAKLAQLEGKTLRLGFTAADILAPFLITADDVRCELLLMPLRG